MPDGAIRRGLEPASTGVPPKRDSIVWILLGNRTGDDNQVRALAQALGYPFEEKTLRYNGLRHVPSLRDERLLHVTRETRSTLLPPWPDLVIGLGYESLPVSRFIRRQSRGQTRIVQIGNPRSSIDDLALVIATPQYPMRPAPNLLKIPLPIGNPARSVTPTYEEERWIESLPGPRRLIAVGGSTRQWKLDQKQLDRALQSLKDKCATQGGSVIAVTSRRTPPDIVEFLETQLLGPREACVHDFPRFATLLARCDEFHVTADSVSMLSEAILTGKPVGLIPIRRSMRGIAGHLLRKLGMPIKAKAELPTFWAYLTDNKLVGSIEAPLASQTEDTVKLAADAVREVLEKPRAPVVWALLGARKGDNNQVLALAEALGLPFETKLLTYNRWRHLGPHVLGATLRSLTPSSRDLLSGAPPDLVLSTGHRSVAVVQYLRELSGGQTRSIHVGYPRISPGKFDLVISTPEYPMGDHSNLLRIPFALTRKADPPRRHRQFWKAYPKPRRLLILGGPTLYWRLSSRGVSKALNGLLEDAGSQGGSVLVVGSPRTPKDLLLKVQARTRRARAPAALIPFGGSPSYAELLHGTDSVFVTADSVAMVSDAISTGRPVELVPVQPTFLGRSVMALMDRIRPSQRTPPHDLRAFWRTLQDGGLVGTAQTRRRPSVADVNSLVASRVRTVLSNPS